MHKLASFNCGQLPASEAKISAASSASLYGIGIFTTLAIYNSQPFLWEKHWKRLENNSSRIGIDLVEFNKDKTRRALDELVAANSVQNGRARISFFDESATGLWPYESERGTSLLITTGDLRSHIDNLSLAVSQYPINSASPLAGVKSCNYLEKILALDEARQRGIDEAIQLNERGEIASAYMANVFWLKDGKLFTPSLKTGCLAGTTREFVLESLECEEVEADTDHLRAADEIFLTSAGLGVIRAVEFDGRKLNCGPHPIANLLPRHR